MEDYLRKPWKTSTISWSNSFPHPRLFCWAMTASWRTFAMTGPQACYQWINSLLESKFDIAVEKLWKQRWKMSGENEPRGPGSGNWIWQLVIFFLFRFIFLLSLICHEVGNFLLSNPSTIMILPYHRPKSNGASWSRAETSEAVMKMRPKTSAVIIPFIFRGYSERPQWRRTISDHSETKYTMLFPIFIYLL